MCGGLFTNLCIGGGMIIRSSEEEEEDDSSLAVEEVEGVLSVEGEEEAVAAAVAAEEEEEVVATAVVAEEEEEVVAAVAAVEEEEEEPALGLETVELVAAAAVEEEDAVVDVEIWLGTSKFSIRRLLTRLLLCMVLVYFRLPGMFQLEKKLCKRKSHLRRSYLNDASNENAVSALLFIHFSGKPV